MHEPLELLRSAVVVVDRDHVDTDQIVPARFLTTTTRDGLGAVAFANWRGQPDCALDDPRAAGATILVAGENFGCGSSREHAVWALRDFGFRAVIAPSIGDIFQANALKNGLVPVVADVATCAFLRAHAWLEIELDLPRQELRIPGRGAVGFDVDPFGKHCLVRGVDPLGFLQEQGSAIDNYEASLDEEVR